MNIKNIIFLFFFIFIYKFIYCAVNEIKNKPSFDDEILVEYNDNFSEQDSKNFYINYNVEVDSMERAREFLKIRYKLTEIPSQLIGIPFVRYKTENKDKLLRIVEELQKLSFIKYAQPNYKRYALYTPIPTPQGPNDWYYQQGLQYGFNLVKADQAFTWGFINPAENKTIIVAVLDTGVRVTHRDLAIQITPDIPAMTVNGYNVLDPGYEPYDDGIDGGHGTHIAGIISARTNDNQLWPPPLSNATMAGAAYTHSSWSAKVLLMPIKVLSSNGEGYDSDVYTGVKWAVDNGAKVLNYSFGGYDPSPVLQNAINYAAMRGCINVGAAGNDSINAYYPAAYSNVISVASCNQYDVRSGFSNYGKIDVTAPGEDIFSINNISDNSYSAMTGTSFAAPYVSALAALLMLKYTNVSPVTIRKLIEQTADDIGAPGYDKYTGWGRINFTRALNQDFNMVSEINTYNWPNPFSPEMDLYTNITFFVDEPTDINLIIYDAAGDVVWKKNVAGFNITSGQNFIIWDGKNSKGKTVASGTYFYILNTGKMIGKNKILVLH